MKNRSGQVSVEFMLLVGLVLIVFLPIIAFMTLSGIDSADRIVEETTMDFTVRIVDEARDTYYLGTFNKKVITMRTPRIVTNLSVLNASGPDTHYYLEVHYVSAGEERMFRRRSEVPLGTLGSCSAVTDICTSLYTCQRCMIDGFRAGAEQNIELRTQGGPLVIRVV